MSVSSPDAEFRLIDRIRERALVRNDVVLGIGDDAALVQVPAGCELVVSMDTLNADVHFPADANAADIGWKALAVNLSDLAAMGAKPAWCTLSLSLPEADVDWVDGFLDGFSELARAHQVALVGGDTTRGPLSVCITAHGFVDPGRAMRRSGARVGDDVWVSGTLGDAAAALALRGIGMHAELQGLDGINADIKGNARTVVEARLARPTPRIAVGRAIAGFATSCIDVSDGLLADLAHIARAGVVGLRIEADSVPHSASLQVLFDVDARRTLQLAGGDDYELAFTAPPSAREALREIALAHTAQLTRIGSVTKGSGTIVVDSRGEPIEIMQGGYQHFPAEFS